MAERRTAINIGNDGSMSEVVNPHKEMRRVARENIGWKHAELVDRLHDWQYEILARFYPSIHTLALPPFIKWLAFHSYSDLAASQKVDFPLPSKKREYC